MTTSKNPNDTPHESKLGDLLKKVSTTTDVRKTILYTVETPHRHLRPGVPRDKDRIPEPLRLAMNDCVMGRAPWPLTIYGSAGTGKTCAGLFLCDHSPPPYHMWTVVEICDIIAKAARQEYYSSSGWAIHENTMWDDIKQANLVVLDELGEKMAVTDHHYSTLKRIIDTRGGVPAPLVMIANMGPKALGKVYDDRISSRIMGGTIVSLTGQPDQRRMDH